MRSFSEHPTAKRTTRTRMHPGTKPIRRSRTRRNPSIREQHPPRRTSSRNVRSNTMFRRRSKYATPVRMKSFFPGKARSPIRGTGRKDVRSIPEKTFTRSTSHRSKRRAAIISPSPARAAVSSSPSRRTPSTRRFRRPHTASSPSGAESHWSRHIRTGDASPVTTTGSS